MTEVHVTGLGFATSIGVGRDSVATSLCNLRHGFVCRPLDEAGEGPELVVGTVDGFDLSSPEPRQWTFPGSASLSADLVRGMPPHGCYALIAVQEALAQAGIEVEALGDGRTGLYCASAGSPRLLHHHLSQMERAGWQRSHPMCVVSSIAGTLNFNLAAHLGITGANCGFVSACASSSHALGYAFDEIALGRQQRMLVVAGEDGNAESLLPFLGMRALSSQTDPDLASRPFDRERDGFVGTAGGVAMVLESGTSLNDRNASSLATLRGWAQASDGYNIAAPHPEGRGLARAMRACLEATGTGAEEVDWVNAHATSTPAGDRAEALALKALGFGAVGTKTAVSSTKGLTGHALSFAGLLEAAIIVLCLREQIIPGNAGLRDPDPVCEGLDLPTATLSRDLHLVLNNSSGFGGANVCHLFQRS